MGKLIILFVISFAFNLIQMSNNIRLRKDYESLWDSYEWEIQGTIKGEYPDDSYLDELEEAYEEVYGDPEAYNKVFGYPTEKKEKK